MNFGKIKCTQKNISMLQSKICSIIHDKEHRRTQTNKNVCVVYTVYAKRWRSKTFSLDAESYTLPISDGSNLRFRKEGQKVKEVTENDTRSHTEG